VAFELKDEDMHAIFDEAGFPVTKPELSAVVPAAGASQLPAPCGRPDAAQLPARVEPAAASCLKRPLGALVDALAAEPGFHHLHLPQLLRRNREDVAVDQDEVGRLARCSVPTRSSMCCA
jgi:hypothetical protein